MDFDDILNIGKGSSNIPSNRNPRDAALQCITDLMDCCVAPHERGNWYFPNGTRVGEVVNHATRFLVNRGQNEDILDGENFNGSVRLFRRFSAVPERGRFYCELPSAADPSVNQTLYVNICKSITQLVCTDNIIIIIISTVHFGFRYNLDHVTISPSTGSTATVVGVQDYSLNCSITLFKPSHLSSAAGVPSPTFQWSFDNSTSLPSGVTAMPTVISSMNDTSETYSSTLQFSPLSHQSHEGMYTCRLGPGRLMNSALITVNSKTIIIIYYA